MAEKTIAVTQIRSSNGRSQRQKDTLKCLGLGRIGRTVMHSADPSTLGMVRAVAHLVKVEEVSR